VSYHALALSDGLPVQIVKDRAYESRKRIPDGLRKSTIGHLPSTRMELMGIEPTTSGLQNRRSPS
jgi:hypothetical protein